jgi:UDP-N-acetylmuramate dehydrogenase
MDKIGLEKLKDRFPDSLREHFIIKDETALRVGGIVDYFLELAKIDDLIDAITIAQENNIPYIVFGKGSNIIFSDYGFPGLVIANRTNNISFLAEKSQVIVDGGVSALSLAIQTASRDLGGIEFLATATGTIGSAIYNHLKIDRHDIFDQLIKITIINPRSEILTYKSAWLKSKNSASKLKDLKKNDLEIDPKNTDKEILKKKDPIILTAIFQLQQSRQEDIIRKINVFIKNENNTSLPISGYIFNDTSEAKAVDLLQKSGVNKLHIGDIWVNGDCVNRILNKKNGCSTDARKLIELMQQQTYEKTGIMLTTSIEYLGVW